MERRRGRPRHPDVLTPAEWRVLEEVRRGRPNAEIAVRLGVSVNTVRYHVSNILAKLGLTDRDALRRWRGRPRMKWGWLVLGSLGVGGRAATVLLAAITVAGLLRVSQSAEVESVPAIAVEAPAATSSPAPAVAAPQPAPLPFEQHADYRAYTEDELEAAAFVNTGAFLRIPYNPFPAAESSYRADFTGIRVARDGYVDLAATGAGWTRDWFSASAAALRVEIQEQRLSLVVSGQYGVVDSGATGVMMADQHFVFYSVGEMRGRPELMIALTDADGRPYPVIIDERGSLWVRLTPVSPEPRAYDTGELLALSDVTTRLGPLPKGVGNWSNLTWCEGGVCRATIHTHEGGGLPALVAGVVTCTEADEQLTIELDAGDYRLRFEAVWPMAIVPPGCAGNFPRDVDEGELISSHHSWTVTAFDAEGRQLSVASDDERWLYIGGFEPTITHCPPCRQGV